MRLGLAGMTILLLGACGGGASDGGAAGNTANVQEPGNGAQARVQALSEEQRNAVLIRAIRDARQNCQHVEGSTLSQSASAVPVYLATCDDGAVFAVAIASDGNAAVTPVTPPRAASK